MLLATLNSVAAMVRNWPWHSTSPSRWALASKWSAASTKGMPVSRASSSHTRRPNSGWVLMPVPTAVPPMGSSNSGSSARRPGPPRAPTAGPVRRSPGRASAAWRRPGACGRSSESSFHSAAFRPASRRSAPRPGSAARWIATAAATWMAVGNTSLVLWPRLTWSLGWIGFFGLKRSPPDSSIARLAITSLAFILLEVPEPVWKTSTGNWSSNWPSATSRQAASRASICRALERPLAGAARAGPGRDWRWPPPI